MFKLAICSCVRGSKYVRNYKYNRAVSFDTRTSAFSQTRSVNLDTKVDVDLETSDNRLNVINRAYNGGSKRSSTDERLELRFADQNVKFGHTHLDHNSYDHRKLSSETCEL